MNQSEQREYLKQRLTVATGRDGVVYVVLDGIPLGRVTQDPDSTQWRCEWRSTDGWRFTPTQLRADGSSELAEAWAVDEIAAIFAIDMGGHFGYDGPT